MEETVVQDSSNKVVTVRLFDGTAVKLECCDRLASTSALAKEYARAGYPDRYAVFTEKQSLSPITKSKLSEGEYEEGVFLSVILRPSLFPSQLGLLAPLASVALITALDEHIEEKPKIGWVSDVYINGIHQGGVSVEGKLDSFSSYEYMIISFAIRLDEKSFSPRMTDMIKQVFESENFSVPMIIAKEILAKFFTVYSSLKTPEKYMDIYEDRFVLTGKKIKHIVGDKKETVRVLGINKETCALTVETKDKTISVTSPSGVIIPRKIKQDKEAKLIKESDKKS